MSTLLSIAAQIWSALGFVLPFLAVATTVVFVHELGHFLVGRWLGARVEVFSLGMGPELIGYSDRLGARWRVSAIPIGGYVRFAGDQGPASAPGQETLAQMSRAERETTLAGKPLAARALIVIAGPAANLVFAMAVFSGLTFFSGERIVSTRIATVVADSPAAAAGFQPHDVVTSADGQPIATFADLFAFVSARPGAPIHFTIRRADRAMALTATPAAAMVETPFGPQRLGRLGIVASNDPSDARIVRPGLLGSIRLGAAHSWAIIAGTTKYVGRLATGRESPDKLAGPIGIARMSHAAASYGLLALVDLTAMLSLSLGLMNLAPMPLLDGGHLLLYAIEAARGRPMSLRAQEIGMRLGLACILALALFVTLGDIRRLLTT